MLTECGDYNIFTFLQLQIWDTAGQERFRTITQSYYRSADAIVLVYDIGSAATFRNLPEWLSEVDRYAGQTVHRILIGNKSDRTDREINMPLGQQFAQENDMPFLETSAKSASNIDKLFEQLARTLKENHVQKGVRQNIGGAQSVKSTISVQKPTENQVKGGGGGCC